MLALLGGRLRELITVWKVWQIGIGLEKIGKYGVGNLVVQE